MVFGYSGFSRARAANGSAAAAAALALVLACLPPRSHAEEQAKTFVDVTDAVGLKGLNTAAHAGWGDYNNDGWTDLAVGGMVYRNDRGTFVADELLAKCPSKYESEGGAHPEEVPRNLSTSE